MTQTRPSCPLEALEGIGSSIVERLAEHDLLDTHDLLLVSTAELHAIVDDVASYEQAARWRSMAELLQVDAMTPQWAEALAVAGMSSVEALAFAELDTLRAAFATAVGEGISSDAPDEATLFDMARDAMRIDQTGVIVGRLVDGDGRGIAGAALRFASVDGVSDSRGKFRLIRVPLAHEGSLYAEVGDSGLCALGRPRVELDQRVRSDLEFVLDPDAQYVADLDEFEGDVLPPFDGAPVGSSVEAGEDLRGGDLLFVSHFYEGGEDVKLTSWFRAFLGGAFVVRSYRVSLDQLPEGIALRDTVQCVGSRLVRRKLSREGVAEYRRTHVRIRQERGEGQIPETFEEALAQVSRAMNVEA